MNSKYLDNCTLGKMDCHNCMMKTDCRNCMDMEKVHCFLVVDILRSNMEKIRRPKEESYSMETCHSTIQYTKLVLEGLCRDKNNERRNISILVLTLHLFVNSNNNNLLVHQKKTDMLINYFTLWSCWPCWPCWSCKSNLKWCTGFQRLCSTFESCCRLH